MTAYYNEIDPYAAQWLRNLIHAGHIAPGDVDERSILDVRPSDLAGYTQCHFFAGIGVWSYALRCAGWPDDRPVWTGSCPCQPFSAAGKRGGFADERHLWPAWHHLIRQCTPQNVFGEQVASKDGLGWLDLVSADMEGTGYALWPVDLCAAGVGAPHIRQRLWFTAVRSGAAGHIAAVKWGEYHQPHFFDRMAHACCPRVRDRGPGENEIPTRGVSGKGVQRQRLRHDARNACRQRTDGLANAERGLAELDAGLWARSSSQEIARPPGRLEGHGDALRMEHATGDGRIEPSGWCAVGGCGSGGLDHHHNTGLAGHRQSEGESGWIEHGVRLAGRSSGAPSAVSRMADDHSHGCNEAGQCFSTSGNDGLIGNGSLVRLADAGRRQLPQSVGRSEARDGNGSDWADHDGRTWGAGPAHGPWANADWLFCRDGKWRPVESGTFPLAHGAASRVGRLRAYGNAIVAEAASTVIATYLEAEAAGFEPLRTLDLKPAEHLSLFGDLLG